MTSARVHEGLRYEVHGAGEPTLLLLHPAFTHAGAFAELVDALSGAHRIVCVDLPGHGGSLGSSATLGDVAPRLDAILAREGVDAAVLVGVSLGSLVAQELARRFPARARSLIAVGGFEVTDATLIRAQRRESLRWLIRLPVMALLRRFIVRRSAATPRGRAAMTRLVAGFSRRGLLALRGGDRILSEERDDALRCPLWIVIGARELEALERAARRWHARAPGSRLEVVVGAGHCVQLDAPEAFAALVREHVAALGSGATP